MTPDFSLTPTPADQADAIRHLMPDYLQEMSNYTEVPVNDKGELIYPYLEHYWREPDRFPYLIRTQQGVAGFAMVRQLLDPANGKTYHSMAEFYVAPGYRRRGLGENVAEQAFRTHPGCWELSVLKPNQPARVFWQGLIERLAPAFKIEDTGESLSYRFEI